MDATAAQAASALQHLSRLCISVQACGPLQEPTGDAPASPGSYQRSGSEGGVGSKPAAAGIVQRWQEHPVWGQLPLLARLQVLAVGAELPAAGGECEAEPAVLPYDWLEGGVPDGIMDCRWAPGGCCDTMRCLFLLRCIAVGAVSALLGSCRGSRSARGIVSCQTMLCVSSLPSRKPSAPSCPLLLALLAAH